MILIKRGSEPAELAALALRKLAALRALGREPTADDIDGYQCVAETLCSAQHKKCCYCEQRIKQKFNDVEHYRPKGRANREPGCPQPKHGYWWLAFSWHNLLFACASCNRIGKNCDFPLDHGSTPLLAEQVPPGQEKPLLLNPAGKINPVQHIEFKWCAGDERLGAHHWRACARKNSQYGKKTIEVCELNSQDLLEIRDLYFQTTLTPQIKALDAALVSGQLDAIANEYARAMAMLQPINEFVGLSYDCFRQAIPSTALKQAIGKGWPPPAAVGV